MVDNCLVVGNCLVVDNCLVVGNFLVRAPSLEFCVLVGRPLVARKSGNLKEKKRNCLQKEKTHFGDFGQCFLRDFRENLQFFFVPGGENFGVSKSKNEGF